MNCEKILIPQCRAMQFLSSSNVNCLFWITSLADSEKGVTRRITEELEPFSQSINLIFEVFEPKSSKELTDFIDDIAKKAEQGWRPIIHLDTHGLADRGIKIHNTGEFISWPILADKFRSINIATRNNLCVISHACFSFNIVRELDVKKATPFYMLFAPKNEILAGKIEDNTIDFYRDIFSGKDIISSHMKYFSEDWDMFHCEKMVAVVLGRYIDAACLGQRAQRRQEHLITMAVQGGVTANRHNMRKMRSLAKKRIKPDHSLIERFSRIFLIGRNPNFTISQLVDMIREGRKNGSISRPSPYDAGKKPS